MLIVPDAPAALDWDTTALGAELLWDLHGGSRNSPGSRARRQLAESDDRSHGRGSTV
jgi:hypothetical protein